MGDLKLSLDERVATLKRVRSKLKATRREANVARTAQAEKARFEAHRPSRFVAGVDGGAAAAVSACGNRSRPAPRKFVFWAVRD